MSDEPNDTTGRGDAGQDPVSPGGPAAGGSAPGSPAGGPPPGGPSPRGPAAPGGATGGPTPGGATGGPVPGGATGDRATGTGATGPVFEPVADGRDERWACPGPAEIEVTIGAGRVEIDLTGSGQEVRVRVRADPSGGGPWNGGLGGLIDWIGTMSRSGSWPGMPHGAGAPPPAGRGFDPIVGAPWERGGDPSADAVAAATVSWSDSAHRLVVRGPDEPGLASVPLVVTVSAPRGSRLATRTGAADVRVRGQARWAAVRTGSGTAELDEVDGDVDVTTGDGGIELGAVSGRARIRAGSGAVHVGALGGPSHVRTGSGDVRVGEVAADVELRTGSGDVVLADAVAGTLQVSSGSGGIRVGVHSGVGAELDLSTGSGQARSDLGVGSVAPETPPALRISGRTGSGDVLVTRATPVPA